MTFAGVPLSSSGRRRAHSRLDDLLREVPQGGLVSLLRLDDHGFERFWHVRGIRRSACHEALRGSSMSASSISIPHVERRVLLEDQLATTRQLRSKQSHDTHCGFFSSSATSNDVYPIAVCGGGTEE